MSCIPLSAQKNEVYLVAAVAHDTGLIVAAQVTTARDLPTIQLIADTLPSASTYCTDAASVYTEVIWPNDGQHRISMGKEATQRIESLNANFRTYLGRLARASRCFSRHSMPYAPRSASLSLPIMCGNAS